MWLEFRRVLFRSLDDLYLEYEEFVVEFGEEMTSPAIGDITDEVREDNLSFTEYAIVIILVIGGLVIGVSVGIQTIGLLLLKSWEVFKAIIVAGGNVVMVVVTIIIDGIFYFIKLLLNGLGIEI